MNLPYLGSFSQMTTPSFRTFLLPRVGSTPFRRIFTLTPHPPFKNSFFGLSDWRQSAYPPLNFSDKSFLRDAGIVPIRKVLCKMGVCISGDHCDGTCFHCHNPPLFSRCSPTCMLNLLFRLVQLRGAGASCTSDYLFELTIFFTPAPLPD